MTSTDTVSRHELRRVESELRSEISDLRWALFSHKLNAMTVWAVVANAVIVAGIFWIALRA